MVTKEVLKKSENMDWKNDMEAVVILRRSYSFPAMVIFVPKCKEDKRAIFENIWYHRSSEYKSLGLAWNLFGNFQEPAGV